MSTFDKIKADFKVMDIDGKGRITFANLKRILNSELNMEVPDDVINDMMEYADLDKDGDISEREFTRVMKKVYKQMK